MMNVRIDENGDLRCWNCGGLHFRQKRTVRSKATVVGALSTKKKLKCQQCGKYNDAGNAQPYTQPMTERRKMGFREQVRANLDEKRGS